MCEMERRSGSKSGRTMQDTRCFLEEHRLSLHEEEKEEGGKAAQCATDSCPPETKNNTNTLDVSHCVSCSEYQHIVEAEKLATATSSSRVHVLLDVRVPHQYALCALPNALNIPLAQLPTRLEELRGKGDIYVMCRRGIASVKATEYLLDQQFDSVFNVNGGLDAWCVEVDASLPMY